MRCDRAQRLLSDRIDGPLPEPLSQQLVSHVAGCPDCAAFDRQVQGTRRRLRVAALEPPPDIAGAVRRRLQESPPRRRAVQRADWLRVAAVFVVAFGVGAAAVGLGGPRQVVAVELAHLVLAGQHDVRSLQATVTVDEHGWHPDVPTRQYTGSLAYTAPETLALDLQDRTSYPGRAWLPNDVTVVVDGETAWSRSRPGCPTSALPECSGSSRTTIVRGREPFDTAETVPLDLVVPVASFGAAATGAARSATTVDGRDAVEVTVSVTQLRPLLDGVLAVGAWRQFHPSDQAVVALDARFGIPLRVEVRAGEGNERERWAAAEGYVESTGQVLWRWTLTDVEVNAADVDAPPAAPGQADVATSRGFEPGRPSSSMLAGDVGMGLAPHRAGSVGEVEVASWSDGRAWVRIRVHPAWDGGQLFGRRGDALVRRVELASGNVAYVAEGGGEVFVHTDELDVAIDGTLSTERLLDLVERLDVPGLPVPRGWAEASVATLAQARQELAGLLVPSDLPAFTGPGVRVSDQAVTLSYGGNGDRGFVLVQGPGDWLTPPLDDVVLGVAVRGVDGRYTPGTGTLEWVEDGRVITLRSLTLSLPELLGIAAGLEGSP